MQRTISLLFFLLIAALVAQSPSPVKACDADGPCVNGYQICADNSMVRCIDGCPIITGGLRASAR